MHTFLHLGEKESGGGVTSSSSVIFAALHDSSSINYVSVTTDHVFRANQTLTPQLSSQTYRLATYQYKKLHDFTVSIT